MENVVKICMGSSCFSRGNNENLKTIKEFIYTNKIEAKVILTGDLCEGRCNIGPNLFINNKLYNNVNSSNINKFLDDLLLVTTNV